MKREELLAALEAVLFASGEPITIDRLSLVFDLAPEKLEKALMDLKKKYDDQSGALELLKMENAYQLSTKKDYAEWIKKCFDIRRKTPLSGAALEVLAVIAYNQPVTKSFIEQVRGVDCSGVVSTLVEKELIEERGRLELPGRPLLYGTTKNFLRCFSLSDLSELPPLPKTQQVPVGDMGEQLEMISDLPETAE